MKPLLHLTLNTGDCVEQFPTATMPLTCLLLMPLVKQGSGPLPDPFGAFRVEINRQAHGAVFTVYRGRDPIVTCGLCWGVLDAEAIWGAVNGLYLQLVAADATAPTHAATIPDRLPWLAVVILPGIVAQRHEDISWLGDFERCLAFAILQKIERGES